MGKHRLLVTFIVLILSMILIACSGDTESEGKAEDGEKKGTITLYSPNIAAMDNVILAKFEEETGIKVERVSGGAGELLKRVEAEADNPMGDVFWAGGADSFEAYSEYFEPYERKEQDKIEPSLLMSKDNSWAPFHAIPTVIIYNKDMVDEGEIEGWADLLDEKWKGNIAFADPTKSSSAYTQLYTMLLAFADDGKEGWGYVEDFVDILDGKILSGSGLVPKAVSDGEFAIGLTLEGEAIRFIEGGSNMGIVYPKEGTAVRPSGSGLIKGSKNPEEAKQFLDFLLSVEVQEIIQEDFHSRSVRTDVEPTEGLKSIDEIEKVDYDIEYSAENRDDIMEGFTDLIKR